MAVRGGWRTVRSRRFICASSTELDRSRQQNGADLGGRQWVPPRSTFPRDLDTIRAIIRDIEKTTGCAIERLLADVDYKDHNAPLSYRFRIYTQGQNRRMSLAIKRELRRRVAVDPVLGHIKNEHRMGRNYLAHARGRSARGSIIASTLIRSV